MVKGGKPAGEQVGRLVGEVGGEAEPQVAGHRGHGRDQQQRVVDRQLDRFLERHVHRALVDVVDPDDIGDEQPVEQPALQQLGQLGPVLEALVLGGGVPWVGPQAVVDVPDAVHVEGVEQDLLLGGGEGAHQMVPAVAGSAG